MGGTTAAQSNKAASSSGVAKFGSKYGVKLGRRPVGKKLRSKWLYLPSVSANKGMLRLRNLTQASVAVCRWRVSVKPSKCTYPLLCAGNWGLQSIGVRRHFGPANEKQSARRASRSQPSSISFFRYRWYEHWHRRI